MIKDLIWHNSIFPSPEREKIVETLPKALLGLLAQRPDSPAVIFEDKTFTFSDLAKRAAGLSDEINELGNHPGPIAILQKVGLDTIAAWFACSLSSKPFLLLEPDNPSERLVELIKASGCTLALVDRSTSSILSDLPDVTQLISEGRFSTFNPDQGLKAEDPAMIFPTSGSTGNPKLITYSTTTIQVKVQSSIQLMRISEGARVLIAGSHSNYGFLHHALVFLLSGNSVYLADVKISGFDSILHGITNFGVRHVRFTPSLFRKLAVLPKAKEALWLLHAVRFSGEPLLENDLKLAQPVLNSDCLIQNVYGSTESSLFIWKSNYDDSADAFPTAPIGKIYPLSSYAIRPLEDGDNEAGKGELLIRSKFHAIGDLKDGVLDRERFPLVDGSSDERIYATGDIVLQLSSGNLLHLGRLGRMIKIRGNRVYLTEIEQQLSAIPGVKEAVVVDRIELDDPVIYGFITIRSGAVITEEVRSKLSSKLPDFMIPKRIETLSQIPLLAGGKVDIQSLITLISSRDPINQLGADKNDSDRLIQIWDSHLWKGAHNHISDYFSLGGDSLGFMILLEELEQNFGERISPEKLRTQCTLKNIAEMLGIESPTYQGVIKYKSLKVSFIWPSLSHSKGIALAMPNYGGSSNAYPFYQAGFFQDYDIWAVEFPIHEGNMLDKNRWSIAALEIVQGIQEGIIPTPRIVFGFSFDGGLAWLVGRLLADYLNKPDFIVMVDAPPLHRRQKLYNESLEKVLKSVSDAKMPSVLHIRRSPQRNFVFRIVNEQEWHSYDNIQKLVDLPTVEHMDMINWEMLTLAKDVVTAFLNNKELDFQWESVSTPPNLLGCHVFYALNGSHVLLQKDTIELIRKTNKLNQYNLIIIAILMHTNNYKIQTEELIRIALEKFPDSGIVYFFKRRINRNTNMLFSGDLPKIYPINIISVENKLASLKNNTVLPKQCPTMHFYLAYDVFSSLFTSRLIRLKKLVSLSSKSQIIKIKDLMVIVFNKQVNNN